MIFSYVLPILVLSGCGPYLTRPGYKPPPEGHTPIQDFQDAENALLGKLKFSFSHSNFDVLKGVSSEVKRVIRNYPPDAVSGANPQILSLHIEKLIDQVFTGYMDSKGFEATHDKECVRDYTQLCPSRWVDTGDSITCESPPSLFENEECRSVQFGGMTPLEKSSAAWNCGESKYPCRNECIQNYSQLCPNGWKPLKPGSTTCIAPRSYTHPCVTVYDFKDHNIKLKRRFADMCKVSWPCWL